MYIKSHRGSLNLEMALIMGLLVIAAVGGLGYLGGNISNQFINPHVIVAGKKTTTVETMSTENALTLSLKAADPATVNFEVQRDNDPEFNSPTTIIVPTNGSMSATYSTTAVPNTELYIRVRSMDENNNVGVWSETNSFDVNMTYNDEPVFVDNFNRTDSYTVGNGWTQKVDTSGSLNIYGIKNNSFYASTNVSQRLAIYRNSSIGSIRSISYKINNIGLNLWVFVGRRNSTSITDVNNGYGYFVQLNSNKYFVIQRADGTTSTVLGGISGYTPQPGDIITLDRYKDVDNKWKLRILLNGVVKYTVVDETYMTDKDINSYGMSVVSNIGGTNNVNSIDDLTLHQSIPTIKYISITQ